MADINQHVSAFVNFLGQYAVIPHQKLENFTIRKPDGKFMNVNVPAPKIIEMFDHCKHFVDNNLRFVAQEMTGRSPAGFVFDFDNFSSNNIQISENELCALKSIISDALLEMTSNDNIWLYIGTKQPRVKKHPVYKKSYRVHIISPIATVAERSHIINAIKTSDPFKAWARAQSPICEDGSVLADPTDILDVGAHRAVAGLYGSSRPPASGVFALQPPHVFHSLWCVQRSGNRISERRFVLPDIGNHNIVQELSLTQPGVMITKQAITMNSNIVIARPDEITTPIKQLVRSDQQANEIWEMLQLLPKHVCNNHTTRFSVFGAIYSTDPAYRTLALEWYRTSDKFDQAKFDRMWQSMQMQGNGMRRLRFITKQHASASEFSIFEQTLIHTHIMSGIYGCVGNRGDLTDTVIAEIMYNCHRTKFVSDPYNNRWYTFVEPTQMGENDSMRHNKWTVAKYSGEFRMTITKTLRGVLPDIIAKLDIAENNKSELVDAGAVKGIKQIRQQLRNSAKRYENATGQTGVERIARDMFVDRTFIKDIDKCPDVIGLRGGVLMLCTEIRDAVQVPAPRMLSYVHDQPVTLSADAYYCEYTEEISQNPMFLTVLEFFLDLFAIQECDSFYWAMHLFGQSISGRVKSPMLVNCVGSSRNGKTAVTELIANVLGSQQYSRILPMQLFTMRQGDSQRSNPALMAIRGARYITVTESERGDKLASDTMKTVVGGGGKVSSRHHHGEQEEFVPVATIIATTNYMMELKNACDTGATRRLVLLILKNKFMTHPDPNNPNEKQDDPRWTAEYPNNQKIRDMVFTILTEFYYSATINYDYDMRKIPARTIERETGAFIEKANTSTQFINQRIVHTKASVDVITVDEIAREYRMWYNEQTTVNITMADALYYINSSKLANEIDKSSEPYCLRGYAFGVATECLYRSDPKMYQSNNKYVNKFIPLRFNRTQIRQHFSNYAETMGTC